MRMAVTVLLLEHLSQYDFFAYFYWTVNLIKGGAPHMRTHLSGCIAQTDPAQGAVQEERRYSHVQCVGIDSRITSGNPGEKKISTSYVERQNLTMRMSMRRFPH